MKEDFLHYLWKFKKFDTLHLKTFNGEEITIINVGQYLELAGPDFFNAQLVIGNQKWAGNVEIHLKSSDWYVHHHERDEAYENVILHVVWEHDTEIFRSNNSEIPVLELKNYVDSATIANYQSLMSPKSWIFCEKQLKEIDEFVFKNWQERLFFERLERKSKPIYDLLKQTNNDWEAVLFCLLAKNFGLNTNGEIFLKIAQSIPFSIIRKESFEVENLEALHLGNAGLLEAEKEDNYFKDLKFRYFYLLHKYQIEKKLVEPVQFFKHRPDNFPTIRLSQLANLYHSQQNLFSIISTSNSVKSIYETFDISTSDYWQNHYQFDKESPKKKKKLSKSFVDLVIINTIIPLQFAYAKSQGKEISEDLIQLINKVAPEKNAIMDKFSSLGIKSKNAFETQSLLQLKNEYCNKSRCLECAIGMELLKKIS
jgi:transposase